MYHRFGTQDACDRVSAETFRRQVQYLKKHFELVTMSDIADQIENGGIRPRQAVLTIDDGYADFHEVALPVLVEEGVPATFFVTTRFVDQDIWLWPDKLEYLLAGTASLELSMDDVPSKLPLESKIDKQQAWKAIVDILLDRTPPERDSYLASIALQLNVDIPTTPTIEYRACNWRQIAEIQAAGIEIGAHTENHPRLTNLDDDFLNKEILGSKSKIESNIGVTAVSFCYPNGAPEDFDGRVCEVVSRAKFRTAVAAYHDGQKGTPYTLRRIGIGSGHLAFMKSVAGVPLL